MTTIIMRADLTITQGELSATQTSPRSTLYSCADCNTKIYINSIRYPVTSILKTGTLDDSLFAAPQAHTWISRKQAWLELPKDIPQFEQDYDWEKTWPVESIARLKAASKD